MNDFLIALRFAALSVALLGLALPLAMAQLNTLMFPHQARGSLIERGGQVVGSTLVGQSFTGERYFHGRPSAAGYDPRAAAGSNLAPSNPALRERAQADSARIAAANNVAPWDIPVDLIAASGGGLDPHISPAAAALQVPRIARARSLPEDRIAALVAAHTAGPTLGIFGQPRVNVLELNLALDAE